MAAFTTTLEGQCPITDLGRSVVNEEKVLPRADGVTVPYSNLSGASNIRVGLVFAGVLWDITELKNVQAEREAHLQEPEKTG